MQNTSSVYLRNPSTEFIKPPSPFLPLHKKLCESLNISLSCLTELSNDQIIVRSSSSPGLKGIFPASELLCSKVIANGAPLLINDLKKLISEDTYPTMTEKLGTQFYAAIPLRNKYGKIIYSLSVHDVKGRSLSKKDQLTFNNVAEEFQQLIFSGNEHLDAASEKPQITDSLAHVLHHAMLGVITCDQGGKITYFNRFAENTVKLLTHQSMALGDPVLQHIPKNKQLIFSEKLKEVKKGFACKFNLHTQNPERFYALAFAPIRSKEKFINGSVLTFEDVTQSFADQRQIIDQNEKLAKFAWKLSHEFRKPVANALGLINLLEQIKLSQVDLEKLQLLKKSIEELDQVVKSTFDFINVNETIFDRDKLHS